MYLIILQKYSINISTFNIGNELINYPKLISYHVAISKYIKLFNLVYRNVILLVWHFTEKVDIYYIINLTD